MTPTQGKWMAVAYGQWPMEDKRVDGAAIERTNDAELMVISVAKGTYIAKVSGISAIIDNVEELEANALLVAASPRLLDACKRMLRDLHNQQACGVCHRDASEQITDLELAIEAATKADGLVFADRQG